MLPALIATSLLLLVVRSSAAAVDGNVWVSLDSGQHQLLGPSGAYSYPPSISADGRFVVFESLAPISSDGDKNAVGDVFRRDLDQSSTVMVSLASDGSQANNRSYAPHVSDDGQLVVFESLASNLVPGDANDVSDIYLRDLGALTTIRVSIASGGDDANGASYRPAISGDGAYVAFCSRATNLAAGDADAGAGVFIYERATATLTRVPVNSTGGAVGGCERVAIDEDGGVVAFAAVGGGRSDVYVYQRASGTLTPLTDGADDSSGLGGIAISGDGRLVGFDSTATTLVAGDSNRSRDVFVRDLGAGTTTRESVRSDGGQLPGDSGASGVAISGDGRFVVFSSTARGVVPGDSNGQEDVFRRDLTSGQTTIVSLSVAERTANNSSYAPDVDADGSEVAYTSLAANITYGDSNRDSDIFVRGTNFPDRAGDTSGPVDTGAPEDNTSVGAVAGDGGGVPSLAYAGGGIAIALILLTGGWFLLGRRGKA
jgi:Tol biopolymer transport system component